MKKTLIFIISLLVLGLTGCDEDFNKDVAPPQTNEQEATKDSNFQVALATGFNSPVNLNDLATDASIQAVTVSSSPALDEGATLSYALQISKTEDFAEYIDLPCTPDDKTAVVTASDLNEVIKQLFGKAPNANPFYVRTYIYINNGTSAVRSTANIVGPATVIPVALPIEPAYYLIGDMNGWDINNLIRFSHSGKNVYEDPHFSALVEVAANTYFKIAPESAKVLNEEGGDFWSLVIGTAVDGDASLEGSIVTENAQAIRIESAGYVKISLNMEEYTYKIEPMDINPYLYVPGNHQGWAPATAPILYSGNMDLVYDGFVYLDGEYKFTSAPDWDHTNYGNGGDGALSADGGAGNLNAATGFYYLKADLNLLTYQQTKTDWGLIGDATAGGWDSSTPMTYDAASNTWTVTTNLTAGAFKFRANDGWDINLGGDVNNLTFGGDNINAEAGNYTITLTLTNADGGYKCTLKKVSPITHTHYVL